MQLQRQDALAADMTILKAQDSARNAELRWERRTVYHAEHRFSRELVSAESAVRDSLNNYRAGLKKQEVDIWPHINSNASIAVRS